MTDSKPSPSSGSATPGPLTKESLAALLNGREYGEEITKAEERQAKAAGLVVIFGYSDDNAELRGAINDEVGCYNGGEFVLLGDKVWDFDECDGPCAHAIAANRIARKSGVVVEAKWCEGKGTSWTYKTKAPHATFDVMEDGERYCQGIVLDLSEAEGHV